MSTTFRGVFLTSSNPEATAEFYRDVARLELEAVTVGGYTYWRLDKDGVQIAIHDAAAFADYASPPNPGSNLTHLYFHIDDRSDFLAHLRTRGLEPTPSTTSSSPCRIPTAATSCSGRPEQTSPLRSREDSPTRVAFTLSLGAVRRRETEATAPQVMTRVA
ncbi:VOC family protein [Salana multivorans]